jgi:hypothetical protein
MKHPDDRNTWELFDTAPFVQMGGLGRVYQLFGPNFSDLLEDLNTRLAA